MLSEDHTEEGELFVSHSLVKSIQVPDWLFLLASHRDNITSYYACLAICMLASNKEIETAVTKSGTLSLVEPFLQVHFSTQ